MDEKYIECVAKAVKYVFKTMLDINAESETAFVKDTRRSAGDITGVIALQGADGDQKGMLSFSTSAQGALAIYRQLMEQEYDSINPEIIDGIGELTNIISGRARWELANENINLYAHVPIVLSGKNPEVFFITKAPIVSIPFSFSFNETQMRMNVDFVFE